MRLKTVVSPVRFRPSPSPQQSPAGAFAPPMMTLLRSVSIHADVADADEAAVGGGSRGMDLKDSLRLRLGAEGSGTTVPREGRSSRRPCLPGRRAGRIGAVSGPLGLDNSP